MQADERDATPRPGRRGWIGLTVIAEDLEAVAEGDDAAAGGRPAAIHGATMSGEEDTA